MYKVFLIILLALIGAASGQEGTWPDQCEPDYQLCEDQLQCVGNWSFCDGRVDCNDGSDEGERCDQHQCGPYQQKCADHRECVDKEFEICNGRADCSDGSDEQGCENHQCHPGMQKCANNLQCVDTIFFCNGHFDCNDESDEQGCEGTEHHQCGPGYQLCEDQLQCVGNWSFCDGHVDCNDRSDEGERCVAGLFDVFGSGRKEWTLAFRGTAGIGQPTQDAYFDSQSESVEKGCLQFAPGAACHSHYRNDAAFDNWEHVQQVAYVVYKNGSRVAHVLFHGQGSNFFNWFSQSEVINSSFEDLANVGKIQNFRLLGNAFRSFLIHGDYGSCSTDEGWTVVVDNPHPMCPWESKTGGDYPRILYARNGRKSSMNGDDVVEADAFGVFVKTHL